MSGSFEDSGKCTSCVHKCETCEGTASNCLTCISEAYRETTGNCNCMQGYEENPATFKC